MHRTLIKKLLSQRALHNFIKTPAPHWLVLFVDMTIVFIAWLFTAISSGTIHLNNILNAKTAIPTCEVLVTYLAVFLIIKPYRSIIRLSAATDIFRIGLSAATGVVLLAVIESICRLFFHTPLINLWNILMVGLLIFSLLTATRLGIKYIFSVARSETPQRKRVIMLGSSINSFALASALEAETEGLYSPVLLLSLSDRDRQSTINGIPVQKYNPEQITTIFKDNDCNTLIFLSSQIDFMRNGGADVFINSGIQLLMLNQIEEFDSAHDNRPVISAHVQNIKIEDLLGRATINTDKSAIALNLKGKTVMITGAAGSIGSEIVRQVATFGTKCIVLVDQAETPMHDMQLELEKNYPNTNIELCVADVANAVRMEYIFKNYQPNVVFHAAAYKHVPMMEHNPSEAVVTNVFGTKNIADLSLKYGIERFVMVSTDKAVNPTNIMGASKRIAEIYVQSLAHRLKQTPQQTHTKFITTRFGNVLGSNGSVIPLFRKQIENGGPVTVTHRDIIRYFMTIPEACSLVLEAGCMGNGGEIYIFDMGNPVKIYDLAYRMISLAGLRPDIDIKIIETGLRPGEKLYEELLNDHESITKTHHKKIMIAKVRVYDYDEVCNRLNTLQLFTKENDDIKIVAQMKRIVPEFKSQNSRWQEVEQDIDETELMTELFFN